MKKQTGSSDLTAKAVGLIPTGLRTKIFLSLAHARLRQRPFVFPMDASKVHNVLIVLPQDLRDALYQVTSVASLVASFPQAQPTLLCSDKVAPYFRFMVAANRIASYCPTDLEPLSKNHRQFGARLSKELFDLCVVLDKKIDDSLCYLVGRTEASVRIGCETAADAPYLNIRIRPNPLNRYEGSRNSALLAALGARAVQPVRWTVSPQTMQESDHLLRELRIDPKAQLVCVDGNWLHGHGSAKWVSEVMGKLENDRTAVLDCNPAELPRAPGASATVPNLSAALQTALLSRAAMVLTGNSKIYPMAALAGTPSLGLFRKKDVDVWYKPAKNRLALTFETRPDEIPPDKIAELVRTNARSVRRRK